MGVPGFFLWFLKKYKNKNFILKKDHIINNNIDFDSLLIDTNCLLHPQCFKVLAENSKATDMKDLERKMLNGCIEYLEYIIDYVNPKKEIYIAIDGVAPTAKIKQQRQRRFKSVNDKDLFDKIKKKHNKEITTFWNNSAITPGTEFMKKITDRIIEFCKKSKYKCKILFSTANTPSEGEHKLLQHIRDSDNDYKYVIYGLDADLIFLALASNKDNIHLLREAQEFNSNSKSNSKSKSKSKLEPEPDITQLDFISIDVLKECVIEELNDILYDEYVERNLNKEAIMRDFIFICYFLGNDFLPHIPSIDIKCYDKKCINGLDLLLQAYANTYDNLEDYLVSIDDNDKISFNTVFLQMFLEYLSSFEEEFFVNMFKSKKRFYKSNSKDPYEKEKHRIENLQFKIKDDIELGKDSPDDYKFRFYKKYYFTEINQKELVKFASYKYLEGLLWVANYYFNKCPSWEWYYPYDHAPFISDLADNFKRFDIDDIKFNLGKPLFPIEQLLCVLPPQSDYLIPSEYRWLMNSNKSPLIHLYPYDFDIDLLYKNKYWQGIPILPDLDIKLVKNTINNKSKEESDVLVF
jgi:5'-3' exonuclease